MNIKIRFNNLTITLALFLCYLVSIYFSFWCVTGWGLYGFLYLPIAIALSVILFGSNLRGVLDKIIRSVSAIVLFSGLSLVYYGVFFSGEQGSILILFMGAPMLCLIFLIYAALWLVQRCNKT